MVAVSALLLAIAMGAGSSVRDLLHYGPSNFQDKAAESAHAQDAVARIQGFDPESSLVVLVHGPPSTLRARVRTVVDRVRKEPSVRRVVTGLAPLQRALRSRDGRTVAVAVGLAGDPETSGRDAGDRVAASVQRLSWVEVGGSTVALSQFDDATQDDLAKAQAVAFPLLLALLFWVFRGVIAAAVPFLAGGVGIAAGLLSLRMAAEATSVSVFALNFVTGLGLGLGIDYSLLIVSRYREEVASGRSRDEALAVTLRTAGRTVAFSSCTVAAALGALLVFPQPFLYSMAIGGVAVSLAAGAASVTLVPAVLKLLGPRIDALAPRGLRRRSAEEGRGWERIARGVMRRPAVVAVLAATLLIAIGAPALGADFTFADARALPADASARKVYERLDREAMPHQLAPLRVVVPWGDDPSHLRATAARLRALPDVVSVGPFVHRGELAFTSVVPKSDPKSEATRDLVGRIRALDPKIQVGGDTAILVDLLSSVGSRLPLALVIVALAMVVGLVLLTGSLVLSLKTLLMGALTLTAALGALVLGFQDAWLSGPLGFEGESAIGTVEPIVLIVLSLALTSDYAAFVLARAREGHDCGLTDAEAITQAIARTGRVVTAAALLLAIAVGSFIVGSNIYVKELGFGVAFAVLIDATVVRGALVPALMALLGRWNWWLPGSLRPVVERLRLRGEMAE